MTDQQRMDSLGCYGNKFVETPNLDDLAHEGVKFENSFTPWPVCSPARATMWNGVYPHKHGIDRNVYLMDDSLDTMTDYSTTLFDILKERGYTTAYFGKWHLGDHNPGSFDIWEAFNSLGGHWVVNSDRGQTVDGLDDGAYKPDVQTDQCIDFLGDMAEEGGPFVMVQGYYPPHDPYTAPQEFYEPYRGKGVPYPGYYAAVSNIDYNVGRIVSALEETGLKDDTVVMFFSDHGDNFNYREDSAHKFACHDESIKVPLIINWPAGMKKGLEPEYMVGLEDLMPTILDYAGCDLPAFLDGLNLRSILEGRDPEDWREFYYVENRTRMNFLQQRCLRTDDWKLVLSDGGPAKYQRQPLTTEFHHLYNLEIDPEEELNIFDTRRDHPNVGDRLERLPMYTPKIEELANLLGDYAERMEDPLGIQLRRMIMRNVLSDLKK